MAFDSLLELAASRSDARHIAMMARIVTVLAFAFLGVVLLVPNGSAQRTNLFGPDDIIEKNGFEWVQPDLFAGVTWPEIIAICPNAQCEGILNNYDMSGWRLANLKDVNDLFYSYIQPYNEFHPLFAPPDEPEQWSFPNNGNCWPWGNDIFSDGFRATSEDYLNGVLKERYIGGLIYGFFTETNPELSGLSQFLNQPQNCGGFDEVANIRAFAPQDLSIPEVGAWFYRPQCVGCGCPAG